MGSHDVIYAILRDKQDKEGQSRYSDVYTMCDDFNHHEPLLK